MSHIRYRSPLVLVLSLLLALSVACASDGGVGSTEATPDGASGETAADDGTDDADTSGAEKESKIAFVYSSPISDAGWTYEHDQGRLHLEKNFPEAEVTVLENIQQGEAERVFNDLAAKGNELIFGTSFGFQDAMEAAAESYPDTVFLNATGFKTGPNLGNYFGAAEEAFYLSGMLAASMSDRGSIGFVAPVPFAQLFRWVNAFTIGARDVNPDATVRVLWVGSFFDPAKERQAAEALLEAGVDVLADSMNSPTAGQAAAEEGIYWVGFGSEMKEQFAPEVFLTAPAFNWGPYYLRTAREVAEGTWNTSKYYGNMADGIIEIAPFGSAVPDDVRAEVEARRAEIASGTHQIFAGPLKDNNGEVVVQEGQVPSLDDLLETDYLVEGVITKLPTN